MKIKVGFIHKGKLVGEYYTDVSGPDDLGTASKLAFEEFRRLHPNLSLLDDGVVVCLAKVSQ
jgi:hypothetical protein